ncbi:MAG TPA: carboxypeptidase-like regulatory domain-containing protein, partial [Gemmatimonadaceae bacterium]|nr:carboxypeptidase-like regulatory domain-containing protein [Gemmatimonadaceae bacterium]
MNVGPIRSSPRSGWRATLSRAAAFVLAAALVATPRVARAQEGGVVAGRVITQTGSRPIIGAQVAVQDQGGRGAVTDAAGRFRITGLTGSDVVVSVRMLGYQAISQTVRVGTTDVQFAMSERALELNRVVVTGTAGGEQKREVGTSVAQVNVAEVTAKQVTP